jgi:hypothetical protein
VSARTIAEKSLVIAMMPFLALDIVAIFLDVVRHEECATGWQVMFHIGSLIFAFPAIALGIAHAVMFEGNLYFSVAFVAVLGGFVVVGSIWWIWHTKVFISKHLTPTWDHVAWIACLCAQSAAIVTAMLEIDKPIKFAFVVLIALWAPLQLAFWLMNRSGRKQSRFHQSLR